MILLIHPWTWGVFAATLLFTAAFSRQSNWRRHSLRALIAAVVLALPLGAVAYSFSPSLRLDLVSTIQMYVSGPVNLASLLTLGEALANMFDTMGPVLSPALLLISLVGAYALTRRRDITASYLLAWIVVWCIGSILVAPSGFNSSTPGIGETGLWRMLYISPLPFLLGLGMEKFLSLAKSLTASVNQASLPSRSMPIVPMVPLLIAGSALFLFWDANVRLLLVIAALILTLLIFVRLGNYGGLEVLMASVLVLLLFNAAFRTLFPLVLDPHSIFFGSAGVSPGK